MDHAGQTNYDRATVASYRYDGAGRRVRKGVSNRADLDGTEHDHYAG